MYPNCCPKIFFVKKEFGVNKELAEGTKRLCVNIDRVVPLKTRYANLTVSWGTNQGIKNTGSWDDVAEGFSDSSVRRR